ncbi:FadR/GntR family transcriptional regulator, partial [Tessaracoccus sp. MC1679]|uniref:FadR/GntR family transcriptional regulator n=1 Tax=Tessaracoccus sp. MC1679 TaxID=2760313 RepID=UPI001C71D410
SELRTLASRMAEIIDPDRADADEAKRLAREERAAHRNRFLRLTPDHHGSMRITGALDILEVRHGTGTFVGQMSLRPLVEGLAFRGVVLPGQDFESLRQIVEVRSGLDHTLAPTVVEHMDDDAAVELSGLCDAMAEHSRLSEPFAAEDRAFHLTLASMLNNELYAELVGAFWDVHTRLGPRLGVPTPRDIADTVAAHRAMLDAAVARDLPAYRAAIENHYAPLLRVLGSAHT